MSWTTTLFILNGIFYQIILPSWPIIKEHISSKSSIGKGSEEEEAFIKDVSWIFKNLNISNILDSTSLDNLVNDLTQQIKNAWDKHSKMVKIMKHSKSW